MWRRLGRGGSGHDPGLGDLEFKRPVFHLRDHQDSQREIKNARSLGAEHGRRGVPGPDHSDAPQVNAYSDRAEQVLGQIGRDWHHVDGLLRAEWCRLQRLLPDRERRLGSLRRAVSEAEARVSSRQKVYEEQLATARRGRKGVGYQIGRTAYALGLSAVFLVDVPINAVVFEVLGESQLATYLLAAMIGILIVPGAHLLGVQARSGFPDRVVTAAALAVPLIFMAGVAILRTGYVNENVEDAPISSGPLWILVFFGLNLTVFASAVFLSYLRHDPYELAIEDAASDLRNAKLDLATARAELARSEDVLASIKGRIAEVHAWGEQEFEKAKDWAAAERNFYEQLIDEYLMANQLARERPQDVVPALETSKTKRPTIPPDLENQAALHWSCNDGSGARS